MNKSLKKLKIKFITTLFLCLLLFTISIVTFVYGYKLTQKPILAVLLFHDVMKNPKDAWEISQNKLEFYIEKLLSLKYKPVDPSEFETLLNKGYTGRNFMITFDDGTINEYSAIETLYKKYGIKSVLFLVDDFINRPENMSEEQIKKLQTECGTHLALHGKHHIRYVLQMKKSNDFGKLTEDTRIKLEKQFGCSIKWISYPFGEYNSSIIKELENKTSLNLAFTIDSGNLDSQTPKMEINRYMYLGGQNENGDDENINLELLPPQEFSIGQLYITMSLMGLFFLVSRVYLAWKYYKALAILRIKI